MSIWRVTIQRNMLQCYLVEADSPEEAATMAKEGLFIQPDFEEEIDSDVVDVDKVE